MSMGVVSPNRTFLCSGSRGPFIAFVDLPLEVNNIKILCEYIPFILGVQVEHYL